MKKTFIALLSLACASLVPISSADAARPGEVRIMRYCQDCGGPLYQRFDRHDGWERMQHRCPDGMRRYSRHHDHDHDRDYDRRDRRDSDQLKRDLAEEVVRRVMR